MARFGARFGRKWEAAIAALLTQPTIQKAARAAGIGLRTLYRYLQDPEFQAAYRKARQEAFLQARALLQRGSAAAVATLYKAMAEGIPMAVRVRAADCFLNHAMKASESDVAEARDAAAESNANLNGELRGGVVNIWREIAESAVPCLPERRCDPPDGTVLGPRHEVDRLQQFFQERCRIAEGDVESWKTEKCWVPVAELYPSYAAWVAGTGDQHPFPKRPFEEQLQQLGRAKGRVRADGQRGTKQIWVWFGIRFNTAEKDRGPCDKNGLV